MGNNTKVVWERIGLHLKANISGVNCLVIKQKNCRYQIQVGIRHGHATLSFVKNFTTQRQAKMIAHDVAARFVAACLDIGSVDR